ncbi:hypothetical protein PAMA_016946 [Pampus argenteus]
MAGSTTSSSTWMLIALLHLCISIQLSSFVSAHPCNYLFEFSTLVKKLEKPVEAYWNKCRSAPTTGRGCQFINITVSPGGCSHPDYFIQGLRAIQDMRLLEINMNKTFFKLFTKLENMKQNCTDRFSLLRLQCDSNVISPVTFQEQLTTLPQKLRDLQS